MEKTLVMKILDSKKIKYLEHTYNKDDGIDAISVAKSLNEDVNCVFKTLVTVGKSKKHYVFVIPASGELDLKKAALAAKEKNIEMIHQKELLPLTGYVHGGCSPIGMKKLFQTFIDSSAKELNTIIISGGKIGYQVELNPSDLINLINGTYFDLTIKNK
ncbi:MAG: Cys-tRNA(Pro) deacylase [Firmicutes bacterium]|uniref:Cys-tRNA(Pro)/Cys-tRNA(Cys) deacylase n=1 Tax=Candidatus Onthovivens merdipullorum TaxID=2840889 RepID=A0A9D9GX74_9BACL|nr:Cys-tRNA(Pro) deacylase [Candidatus Onthovivens merdipullorum]